jgi:hypothetical protein
VIYDYVDYTLNFTSSNTSNQGSMGTARVYLQDGKITSLDQIVSVITVASKWDTAIIPTKLGFDNGHPYVQVASATNSTDLIQNTKDVTIRVFYIHNS